MKNYLPSAVKLNKSFFLNTLQHAFDTCSSCISIKMWGALVIRMVLISSGFSFRFSGYSCKSMNNFDLFVK